MTHDTWYDWARTDAERRDLPAVEPVLEALREASRRLREAAWNADARGEAPDVDASETGSPRAGS
jgi:hypothetical protein